MSQNIKEALTLISYNLTVEIRKIIAQRKHIDTGMLISNITAQAVYNPLRSKTNFDIVYDAPFYWVYVDSMSPLKDGATWNNTCTEALRKSDAYKNGKEMLIKALERDNIDPTSQSIKEISDVIGGILKVRNIAKIIKDIL
jgi:hypothetical protein